MLKNKFKNRLNLIQKISLIIGPLLFLFVLFMDMQAMDWKVKITTAITIWVALWWVIQPIPIILTSLIPVIIFPLFGILSPFQVLSEYTNHIIFLLIGGFFLATALERWKLNQIFVFRILKQSSIKPKLIIARIMAVTAFLSAWITNSAAAMVMMPIANNLCSMLPKSEKFKELKAYFMLSVAYAASIGGISTLIGTTPNLIFAGIYSDLFGKEITFQDWAIFGIPLSIIILIICWVYLTYVIFPVPNNFDMKITKCNNNHLTAPQKKVLFIFLLTVLLWGTRSFWNDHLPQINDAHIAILGAFLLFITSGTDKNKLLNLRDFNKLPFEILLLVGSGLVIAKGFTESGLHICLANKLSILVGMPQLLIIIATVALTVIITQFASNTV